MPLITYRTKGGHFFLSSLLSNIFPKISCIFRKKNVILQKKETMPTIFIFFGFRFMFYSNDHEPIHVHVIKDGNEAKYNVSPLIQIYNHGFKKHDIALIESIISENEAVIMDRWKEYFNQK